MRRARALAVLLMLLLLPGGAGASAEAMTYSFPLEAMQLHPQADWRVLTPATLDENADWLMQMGVDLTALQNDFAVYGTVFEVYMPDGLQVSCRTVATAETAGWGSMDRMSAEAMDALLAAFTQPPYRNVAWSQSHPGYLGYDWQAMAGDIPVEFATLTTVRDGGYCMLTAAGASAQTDALYAAAYAVLDAMVLHGTGGAGMAEDAPVQLPEPVADDGVATPLALVDFTGVSYDDATVLLIQTLPDTDLVLQTPTDMLRGRTGADGLHSYQLSTRRTTQYSYTLTAHAPGRKASTIAVTVDRRLTAEQREETFRKSARSIEAIGGYDKLLSGTAGTAVTFRGSVGTYRDIGAFPGVLVYTQNPGRGTWEEPIWVLLTQALSLEEDAVYTIYGELRGDTLPYATQDGQAGEAPVVISHSVQP